MKINAIQLCTTNLAGDVVIVNTYNIGPNAVNDKYILTGSTGLDANELISLFYASDIVVDYATLQPTPRDISLAFQLNPSYADGEDISTLRDEFYRAISASRSSTVILNFLYNGSDVASVEGSVVRLEIDHFAPVPQVILGVRCRNPFLADPLLSVLDSAAILSAGVLTVNDNVSTAPHGFTLDFTFGPTANTIDWANDPFVISDFYGRWSFSVLYTFSNQDVLSFSSVLGSKSLYVTPHPIPDPPGPDQTFRPVPIMDRIVMGSVWPILFPKENKFTVSPDSGSYITLLTLGHYLTYWGV